MAQRGAETAGEIVDSLEAALDLGGGREQPQPGACVVGPGVRPLEGGIDRSAAALVLGIVSGVMAAVFQPLFIALGVAQYLDLLRRMEQPRSEAMGSAVSQPA